jgi:predicted glycosyltransferase
LAICEHLLNRIPNLSILVISGSPALHRLRIPQGLDYIKLPCLERDISGQVNPKYLNQTLAPVVNLRSSIIKTTIMDFKPDLLLVDKKPYGLKGELKATLNELKQNCFPTKVVLLLRDIIDSPEVTIKHWQENGFYEAVDHFYDQVLVVGSPKIFDLTQEYQFPQSVSEKVKFCGYIYKQAQPELAAILRQELSVKPDESLILITPGGGADGYHLVNNYIQSIEKLPSPWKDKVKSLIISGPEMPQIQIKALKDAVRLLPQVQILEFADQPENYMQAADLIISMGGYNTLTEILSLGKPAVVIPRIKPVKEQLIRAEAMAKLGLFKLIHPDNLTPENLNSAIVEQLENPTSHYDVHNYLNFNGLPNIEQELFPLLNKPSLSLVAA